MKLILLCFPFSFFLYCKLEGVAASENKNSGNSQYKSWDYDHVASHASYKGELDPYKILGVTKDSNQEDIKKHYRNLCLKYHPDKNVHRTQQEREHCENLFKRIQEANSLIGTEQDRKKYDSMTYFQRQQARNHQTPRFYEGSTAATYNDFHSPFSPQFYPRTMRRRAFYVNGVDISHLFSPGGKNPGMYPFSRNPFNEGSMQDQKQQSVIPNLYRSIFMEKVTISLEDLYSGVARHKFEIKDTLIQRYMAAFRGGLAAQIGLQSILTCLPLLFRMSWVSSLLGFLVTFHLSLPKPSRLIYYSKLGAGWKGGTKLKFQSVEPGLDVIFVIKEGKHERFQRDGNNLMTSINVGKSKIQHGCTLYIDPLGKNELPITVKLKPGDITKKHNTVTVVGRGWPKSGGGAGDLLIRVDVVSDASEKRRHRSRRR
mmetsp:Transcript_8069/g.15195  ORF Transcript_8069/g.15195 Transcript_8069/m.15195 type:complete len:428 (-) Transcript_8069:56-1339(-)